LPRGSLKNAVIKGADKLVQKMRVKSPSSLVASSPDILDPKYSIAGGQEVMKNPAE